LNRYDHAADDFYNNQWVYISGTASNSYGDGRLAKDYATNTGTVTPYAAFTAQIEDTTTFEVHPYEPDLLEYALNEAITQCFPRLRVDLVDETVVTGNHAANSHFEDWAATTTPDKHASSGSPTVTQETTIIRGPLNTSSMKVTGGTSSYVYQSQVEWPSLLDLEGYSAELSCWVYCATASKARIQIYTKTSAGTEATTSSSYHSGGSEYEKLTASVTIPANLSDIQIRFTATDDTAYFDNAYLIGGSEPARLYLPSSFYKKPLEVYRQVYGDADDIGELSNPEPRLDWRILENKGTRFIQFGNGLVQKQKLRIVGWKLLSAVSVDTSTVEVEYDEVTPLVEMALAELFSSLSSTATSDDVSRYQSLSNYWLGRAERDLRKYGKPVPSSQLRGLL